MILAAVIAYNGLVLAMGWLIYRAERRVRCLEMDNRHLMHRLGQYHGLELTRPRGGAPSLRVTEITEPQNTIPPAFRMRRPQPLTPEEEKLIRKKGDH